MARLNFTDSFDSKNSFVGIATNFGYENDQLIGGHSAIIIRYNLETYTFHFTGRDVILQKLEDDVFNKNFKYYHGNLDVVAKGESEVAAFLARCRFLLKKAQPKFGFIFDESMYNAETAELLIEKDVPDFCTCVGFCLRVINGVLKIKNTPDYLDISSWELIDVEHPEYIQNIKYMLEQNPEIKIDNIRPFHKRIMPSEFVVTTLFELTSWPISREMVLTIYDENLRLIDQELKSA